jgi:hypothetical protein
MRWRRKNPTDLTTMRSRVAPEALFEAITPIGPQGYCPLAGWVIRRSALARAGKFDSRLRRHDDTSLMVRLAATARLAPGRLNEHVVMRRVHPGNDGAARTWLTGYRQRVLLWATLCGWGWRHLTGPRRLRLTKKLIATLYRYHHIRP